MTCEQQKLVLFKNLIMKPRRSWNELNIPLDPEIKAAINSLNFPTMTPVQAATIPLLLSNKDVAAEAVTGK